MGLGNAIGIGIPMVSLGLGGGEPAIDSRFIIQVKTDNPGSTNNNQFRLPWIGTYDVDWGDGNVDTAVSGTQTHTYSSAGTYDIKVTDTAGQIRFGGAGDAEKLINIKNWGAGVWTDFFIAFNGCTNMILSATDVPDLSGAAGLFGTFANCSLFNSNINNWDVSGIANFKNLFFNCPLYNQPLDLWDTSSATEMRSMFDGAEAFDQNIGSFDTSGVADFRQMFKNAFAFNNGGSTSINNWDTSSATDMYQMFVTTESFNQPIGGWDVSNVLNMEGMFNQAYVGPVTGDSLNSWDVSSVTTMRQMFLRGVGFNSINPNIESWNTVNVTNFQGFLQQSTDFNRDLSNWNISSATTFSLFASTNNGNNVIGDISNWNITQAPTFSNFWGGPTDIGFTTAVYDNILVSWEAQMQTAYPGGTGAPTTTLGFVPSTYSLGSAAETARTSLINTFGWNILDNGGV